jgi:hypothetical protein
MKNKSTEQARLERENRQWRRELIESVSPSTCQLPDCPGAWPRTPTVHEIARGSSRKNAYSERLACLVACAHCNAYRLTDYAIWPLERQAALQCLLCADIAEPAEVLAVLNRCRGRAPGAISWADVSSYLAVPHI